MMYWSDHNGNEATAADVETTAYALLAFLKFDDIRTSGKIVSWLSGQGKAIASWYTTQDTVVALQALAEYSVRTFNLEVKLDIEIQNGQTLHSVSVTNDNALLQKVIPELLVKGQNNILKVTASGNGTARMNIELRWNRNALSTEKCHLHVSSIEIDLVNPLFAGSLKERFNNKDAPCDVCGRCTGGDIELLDDRIDVDDINDKTREADDDSPQKCIIFHVSTVDGDVSHNMSIVKVNLETDVRAIEEDFKELMRNGVIDRYEMPKDGESRTASRQPATVVVYDYYKPVYNVTIKAISVDEVKWMKYATAVINEVILAELAMN
ncbi:CPMD8-like protein [Mya arenaria]|uniref:CPMD8-like protein n=1 Tax=Mya arenaria TaxID=6604 RepID=A0ABY7FSY7_MYAAR|nr:CPMD8-like protein [Mya arenaria]